MAERKKYLNAKEFQDGKKRRLRPTPATPAALTTFSQASPNSIAKWGQSVARSIRIHPSPHSGRVPPVTYLKNRDSTGDLDYLIEPEYVGDADIERALEAAVREVAFRLGYNDEWMNDAMSIFVTRKSRQILFERALKDGVTLFKRGAFGSSCCAY